MEPINPEGLPKPRGYNHGVRSGPLLFIAGQPSFGGDRKIEGGNVVEQFVSAIRNVVKVVQDAGGNAQAIVKMTIYVKDVTDYKANSREIGLAYRDIMGRHYPAMTCVEVSNLYDTGALIEIDAIAVL